MDQTPESLPVAPTQTPTANDAADRRLMLRSMGGALAGLAAGLALTPREAHAEVRPTLTSLDQRVTALEGAMGGVVNDALPALDDLGDQVAALDDRVGALEDAMDMVMARLLAPPVIWKGYDPLGVSFSGSFISSPSQGAYSPSVALLNTASEYISFSAPYVRFLKAGYYSVSFQTSCTMASTQLNYFVHCNGQAIALKQVRAKVFGPRPNTIGVSDHVHPSNVTVPVWVEHTNHFNVGDLLYVQGEARRDEASGPGSVSYLATLWTGDRLSDALTITYLGDS